MDCILLGAGVGTRAKLNMPKQMFRLNGKSLIIISLDLFINIEQIENIIVTVVPEMYSEFYELIQTYYRDNLKIKIIPGGSTRQESVWLALQHTKSQRVIIHESVRPFVNEKHVKDLMSIEGYVVVPYIPIVPTIYNKNGYYEDRDKLCNIQLPQVFNTEILKQAHYKARGKNYSDDSSLVCAEFDILPVLIKGEENNFKITTPLDIEIARCLYEANNIDNRG